MLAVDTSCPVANFVHRTKYHVVEVSIHPSTFPCVDQQANIGWVYVLVWSFSKSLGFDFGRRLYIKESAN